MDEEDDAQRGLPGAHMMTCQPLLEFGGLCLDPGQDVVQPLEPCPWDGTPCH